jgi:hypothetical protein
LTPGTYLSHASQASSIGSLSCGWGWCLYTLPKECTKIRRFGGWSNTRRQGYLERCAILMEAAEVPLFEQADAFDHVAIEASLDQPKVNQCPSCGEGLVIIEETPQPSWCDVMQGPHRPCWYRFDSS